MTAPLAPTPATICLAAAELLRTRGRGRGYYIDADNRVCLDGALLMSARKLARDGVEFDTLLYAAREAVRAHIDGWAIPDWNDFIATDDDVIAVLERAGGVR